MTMPFGLSLPILLVALDLVGSRAASQAQPISGTAAASYTATISRAWTALAAGRIGEAIQAADRLLAVLPGDHDAVTVKISALARKGDPGGAIDAYERWLVITKQEDRFLLHPIAKGVLRDVAAGAQETRLRLQALEWLARAGERVSLSEIQTRRERANPSAYAADASLARLGDSAAVGRLETLATSPNVPDKSGIAEALGSAGSRRSIPTLLALLNDPVPVTRAAAAEALGALGAVAAVPNLQAALLDEMPEVKFAAAVALHRLGDAAGDELLNTMLSSESPDIRLRGAQAFSGSDGNDWAGAITPLLLDPDGLNRLRAAELVMRSDRDAARAVLLQATDDENAAIRQEASRIIARTMPNDLPVLRKLLRDSDAWTRLYAASALLQPAH